MKSPKVAVCITSYNQDKYLSELLYCLKKQTFKDFKIYLVKNSSPSGRAKRTVVLNALKDNPKYIQMIDGDDLVEPTFVETVVKRLDMGDIDWCLTWGNLFGDRTGYIHSEIEPLEELRISNSKRHSWISAKAEVFKKVNYDKNDQFIDDWNLWIKIDEAGFKGAIIEQELYLKRWHDKNLTTTHVQRPNKYRFHIPGYVHLPCSETYMSCAFTQKIVKLSKMLLSHGHEVYIYGAEGSDVPCTEFIQTHTLEDIRKEWGDGDNRFDIGYDWHNSGFRHDFNGKPTEITKRFYAKCVEEINKRKRDSDFLLIMQGTYHKPIYENVDLFLKCEPGIGYRGSDSSNFRAFESSYLQNFTYGSEHPYESINGSYYDRVIPNYFDPKDFITAEPKDYYLYIGRMINRKGVWTAIKTTEAIGAKLKLVGQLDDEIDIKNLPPHCEFLGFADIEKRKKLMAEAIATFVPTIYLEAFGGTHIESMLSGTPPITTNFGVFAETIPDYLNGQVGFRCNTLQDFVDAAKKAKSVDRTLIREYAKRFKMNNVMNEYQKWFDDLMNVWESTVDNTVKGWHRVV